MNGQSLEVMEKVWYLGDAIGAFHSVLARKSDGWNEFRGLLPFLTRIGFPLGAKGRLYSAFLHSFLLYESEAWPSWRKTMRSKREK